MSDKTNPYQNLGEQILKLEIDMRLSRGFFERLRDEQPWSYIIQLCAYYQIALANIIANSLDHAELTEIFAQIPLAESHFGLLRIAKTLNIIDANCYPFLNKLAEIRNILAHNISMVSFDWDSYFKNNHKFKNEIINSMNKAIPSILILKDTVLAELLDKHPQIAIHSVATGIFWNIASKYNNIKA